MIRPDTPTSTGYGHFRAAEQLLTPQPTDPEGTAFRYPTGDDLTAAQAHATLALAAALIAQWDPRLWEGSTDADRR